MLSEYIECLLIFYVFFLSLFRLLALKIVNKELLLPITPCKLSVKKKYYIIIPVYKEVEVIESCLSFYDNILSENVTKNIYVIFVCTQREGTAEINPTFQKILKHKINLVNSHRIFSLIAPLSRKYMAGQINEALRYIHQANEHNSYSVAIYNVDSRYSYSSLVVNFHKLETSNNCVVQQYGCYLNNFPILPRNYLEKIYREAAVWQTSWAIQFEIRNCLYNLWIDKIKCLDFLKNILKKYSYVSGHGLFIKDTLLKAINFTEKFENEDMELSLVLHTNGISIVPGASFSYSDMALNIPDYLSQQAVWARGPFLGIKYAWSYIKDNSKVNSFLVLLLGVKLFLHYVYWLFEPFIIFLGGIFLIFSECYLSLIIFFSLYLFYLYLVFSAPYKKYKDEKCQMSYVGSFSGRFIYIIPFHIMHCFGPLICLKNYLLETLGIKKTEKFKTPKSVST